jgi:hypothetical protein
MASELANWRRGRSTFSVATIDDKLYELSAPIATLQAKEDRIGNRENKSIFGRNQP